MFNGIGSVKEKFKELLHACG